MSRICMTSQMSMDPNNVGSRAWVDEEISICSSRLSEGRNTVFSDNTGWFLATEGRDRTVLTVDEAVKRSSSQDNLSSFGIESPFEALDLDLNESLSDLETSTVSSSTSSESHSEMSNDLNSFSSSDASAADESTLYQLSPVNSFSSFTGIKCHDVDESRLALACADRRNTCSATCNDELRKARALVRVHKGTKASRYDVDEDSIIECIAESHNEPTKY